MASRTILRRAATWLALLPTCFACAGPGPPSPWDLARRENTIAAYEAFLTAHPEGAHAQRAAEYLEDLRWAQLQQARAEGREAREGYAEFLRHHPDTLHRTEAERRLEELDWTAAAAADTRAELEAFRAAHPTSRRTPEVEERLAAIAEVERAAAETARLATLEVEAAAARARLGDDASLADWEAFLERYAETSFRAEAGARVESLADPAPVEALRARMRAALEGESVDTYVFTVDVVLTDALEDGRQGCALLGKEPDQTFVAFDDRGVRPSALARRQAVLRHMRAREVLVLQVTRGLLLEGTGLDRAQVAAHVTMARHLGTDPYAFQTITLGPDDPLVPDLEAPGGRNAGQFSSQKFLLAILLDAEGLAAALPHLGTEVRPWVLDRLDAAGWSPTTEREHALLALLRGDRAELDARREAAVELATELCLDAHPDVRALSADAVRALDPDGAPARLAWIEAAATGSVGAWDAYLATWPESALAPRAARRRQALLLDDAPVEQVLATASAQELRLFLERYPGHAREAEVRALLAGEDVTALVDAGRLVVRSSGRGIELVDLVLRSRSSEALGVRIPVGTVFQSRDERVQRMVATEERVCVLPPDGWAELRVSVVCADRSRRVPGTSDALALHARHPEPGLVAVLEVLERRGAPYAVRQAATWIVTDDASFEALGILRRGGDAFTPGARVLDAVTAVRALQALEEAGLDATERAIWRDRTRLLDLVQDAALRGWLETRVAR